MTDDDMLVAVLSALNALGTRYMITGSLATNFYGVPRSTEDGDLVLETGRDLPKLAEKLSPPLKLDPQMSFETITGTSRHIVEWTGGQYKIELFMLSDDPHDRERFRRRRRGMLLGVPIWLPTAEDIVITKLKWSQWGKRTKDLDDVRNVVAVQGERLDWEYVQRWCDAHGTRGLLEEVRRGVPKLDDGQKPITA